MTSPGDSSSSSSNPTHPTTATTRRRSDSPDYPASKKRRRTFTADDRAQHRVIEKQRREALNEKFIDLARLLPNLAHVRRLSKGLIVDASIAHHKRQRAQRLLAAQEVRVLLAEREGLYNQLETLRAKLKEPPDAAPMRPDIRPETKQILAVEEEVCGTFPAGFGDNGPEDGQEEGENGDSDMRGSRSPERDVSGREVAAKEAGKAISTGTEGSAGKEGNGSAGKESGGFAGKESGGSASKEARGFATREAQTATMKEAEPTSTREAVKEAGFPTDFATDLSPSDMRILADDATCMLQAEEDATRMFQSEDDATRMLQDDATRMLEDDATRMLQDDPFMNPLAPTTTLTDEDLLALLSADITLNLGDDRPSSIPQVYPDKTGNASSPHGLSISPHSHKLSSSPHGLSSPPGFSSLSLSPPHHGPLSPSHHLTAPPDLSPSQIEELWRQLGSVEIPDLGAGGANTHPNGQHGPSLHGNGHGGLRDGRGQHVRDANGQHIRDANGQHMRDANGQRIRDANGQHMRDASGQHIRDANGQHIPNPRAGGPLKPPATDFRVTDDLFGLTPHMSAQVAGSMFGF